MILDSKNITVITDNKSYTEAKFGIGDLKVIFNILRSKLYSNPIKSICREYASNARDAHVEAGIPEVPIEIYLPSAIDNSFRVRDFGFGISPDRINNVFVLYGNSTKRDSNDQIGGFGIGAKVGFAYAEQFQVTTISRENDKNTKRIYIAYIDESEVGALRLMYETETEEPTGTEISISVKHDDFPYFIEGTKLSCEFWDVKPKLYGSEFSNTEFYSDDKYVLFKNSYNKPVVLIDGIIYPLEYNSNICGCVALKFKTGELSLSANREELHYDDKTKKAINQKIAEFNKDKYTIFNTEIDKCENYLDAIKQVPKFKQYFPYYQEFKYKDKIIIDHLPFNCHFPPSKKTENCRVTYNIVVIDEELPAFIKTVQNLSTAENKKYCYISTKTVYNSKTLAEFENTIKTKFNLELSDLDIKKLSDIYSDYKPKRAYVRKPSIKNYAKVISKHDNKPFVIKEKVDISEYNSALYILKDYKEWLPLKNIKIDRSVSGALFHEMKNCLSDYSDLPILLLKSSDDIKPGFINLVEKFEEYIYPFFKQKRLKNTHDTYASLKKIGAHNIFIQELEDYKDNCLFDLNFVSSRGYAEYEENKLESIIEKQIDQYYPMLKLISWYYRDNQTCRDYVSLMNNFHSTSKAAE